MSEERSQIAGGKLVLGLALIAAGAFFLLHYYGLVEIDVPWGWWPLILVAIGVGKLLGPADSGDRRGGLWLILLGSWLIVNFQGYFGLDWATSWPLLLIAGGLMILWGAITDRGGESKEERR